MEASTPACFSFYVMMKLPEGFRYKWQTHFDEYTWKHSVKSAVFVRTRKLISINKHNRMISTYTLSCFIQCKSEKRKFYVWKWKNSFHRIKNTKRLLHWEARIIGVIVQNRLAWDLCNPAVLMCLEWFLKRKAIIPIQITKSR